MDSHIADEKLKQLHVEDSTVTANDRKAADFDIDPVAEKKLLRKIDLRLVPVLWFLYMLAFLDRTNIGNAKIQGMTEDLHMTGDDYNIALFSFFITYILFEVPSNIIIKRVRPSLYLSGIMVCWGIATIGQGLVTNVGGLIGLRLVIGFFEAGFFPGCLYLLAMYYKRYELQWRFNLFFSGAILAGSFSGLLAYGIANMDGVRGYGGWSWIFIIEGMLTVVCALGSWWIIPDWPETATFLTDEERTLLIARLSADVGDAKLNRLDKAATKRIFSDWKIWCSIIMYGGVVCTGYSTSFFVPTIIKELGYTAKAAQVRSIPIFLVATIVTFGVAWLSDRLRHRYAFCMIGICIATIGYVVLLCQESVSIQGRYGAIFLIVTGGYTCQPVAIAWVQNNMAGHYKRSISSAMMIGFGNIGGIIASNIFITSQAPRYPVGYGTALGLLWLCALACTVFVLGVRRENKKRDRGERDHLLEGPDSDNLGDANPRFRFTY
ncbi:hypothetical protein B0A48_12588 [Cryoendolithus antarcticus]|uniref:Major facilitator superfamily (MFS) profile domain-containing protein n=1 Tax=Cryoendolithus antarcticus TaxID=1507870 RepID=A0A1V8SRN7_9PEZI|nr:hypothetical protein B0A48_12588 [Cryoendolithus antarcticus]